MRTLSLPPAEVVICPDAAALSRTAADEIARVIREAVDLNGRCALALAGGSTPRATYAELAAGEKSGARPLPWEKVHIFFSDERLVPPEHSESNFRMAREALVNSVPLPTENIHPVYTHLPPDQAARSYERELRRVIPAAEGLPCLGLILLGLGTDGHTASLFPGTTALEDRTNLVAANWVPRLNAHRITFTFPLLNHAQQVMFLATGADKAQVVREVLRPQAGDADHPAARVRPAQGRLLWLLDEAAAARLD